MKLRRKNKLRPKMVTGPQISETLAVLCGGAIYNSCKLSVTIPLGSTIDEVVLALGREGWILSMGACSEEPHDISNVILCGQCAVKIYDQDFYDTAMEAIKKNLEVLDRQRN